MSWKKRIPKGRLAPEYEPGNGKFTIALHHHGKFTKRYTNGYIDYFDGCCVDEIRMLDVKDMASLCGIYGDDFSYYCSKTGIKSTCRDLVKMVNDSDAANMASYLDDATHSVAVFVVRKEGSVFETKTDMDDPQFEHGIEKQSAKHGKKLKNGKNELSTADCNWMAETHEDESEKVKKVATGIETVNGDVRVVRMNPSRKRKADESETVVKTDKKVKKSATGNESGNGDVSVVRKNPRRKHKADESETVVKTDEKVKKSTTGNESGNGDVSVVRKNPSRKRKADESETVVKTDEKVKKSATGNECGNGDVSVVRKKPSRKHKADENGDESEKVKKVVVLNATEIEKGRVVINKPNENGKKDVAVEKKAKGMVGKGVGLFKLSNQEKLLRIGAEMFGWAKEVEGSEEWRKLEREEMELCLKQLDVKSAKMRLVLDASYGAVG